MKEKALSEALLKQSNKVLDAKDGLISVDDVCSDLNHCNGVEIEEFKSRMIGKKIDKKEETAEPKIVKKSGLTSRSLKG